MKLENKIAVITGAASGIGRAMARRFKKEGASHIVVADLNEEDLKAVADEIGALAIPTDVSKEADVIHLVRTAEEEYGRIDLLCSNAGIGLGGGVEVPNDDWQRIWEI
ncbi:MAG: SDR family NAD(P)-dependent oxidoreductase, partial [Gammaproteobacteria bacterium]|nr:SDR family NAD(P)-dependent oxidoreductase [Gammaproteobacteria bacterium]